jgi:hypothetical protein
VIAGWRGRRVDDHPLCRKCGYDLTGDTGSGVCPGMRRGPEAGRARSRTVTANAEGALLALGLILTIPTLVVMLGFRRR